ncbi:hypothetical protein, partial [Dysosmobacter welbionis]|uniref:hypothetical protein n=1 Tax=Dysosmobacter welbionis TaxID=2093857 RepID=UPI003A8CE004
SAQPGRTNTDGEAPVVPCRIKTAGSPLAASRKKFYIFHCPLDGVQFSHPTPFDFAPFNMRLHKCAAAY